MDRECPFSPSTSANFTLHNPLSEELEPSAPDGNSDSGAPQADSGIGEVNIFLPMMAPPNPEETDDSRNEDDVATAEEGAVGGDVDCKVIAPPAHQRALDNLVEVQADVENLDPKAKHEGKKSLCSKHQSWYY